MSSFIATRFPRHDRSQMRSIVIGARDSPFALVAHSTQTSGFGCGLRVGWVMRPAVLALGHGGHAAGLAVHPSGSALALG